MKPYDFDALAATALESQLWRATQATINAVAAAWRESRVAGALRVLSEDLCQWSAAERVSGVSVAVATAALTHLVLLSIAPRYVASGLSSIWLVAVLVTAVAVALAPWAFVQGWRHSRCARIVGRLVTLLQNNDA